MLSFMLLVLQLMFCAFGSSEVLDLTCCVCLCHSWKSRGYAVPLLQE